MIEEYRFGFIIIGGKAYDQDVEVRWTDEVLSWQRRESHVIDIGDVERAVEESPDVIILGTGESGMVGVTEKCQRFIKEKGIELVIDKTAEAVKTFNVICQESLEEEGKQSRVIGLFHLTC